MWVGGRGSALLHPSFPYYACGSLKPLLVFNQHPFTPHPVLRQVRALTNLQELDLSGNQLRGPVPDLARKGGGGKRWSPLTISLTRSHPSWTVG